MSTTTTASEQAARALLDIARVVAKGATAHDTAQDLFEDVREAVTSDPLFDASQALALAAILETLAPEIRAWGDEGAAEEAIDQPKKPQGRSISSDAIVANTILEQLGGGRFVAMTGARDLLAVEQGLQFKFPNRAPAPNCCRVILTPADLYDVTFYRLRGFDADVTAIARGIYSDQLRDAFAVATGLATSL